MHTDEWPSLEMVVFYMWYCTLVIKVGIACNTWCHGQVNCYCHTNLLLKCSVFEPTSVACFAFRTTSALLFLLENFLPTREFCSKYPLSHNVSGVCKCMLHNCNIFIVDIRNKIRSWCNLKYFSFKVSWGIRQLAKILL